MKKLDALEFENLYSELVNKFLNLSKQEIKDWIVTSFPSFNPDFQFDYTYYQIHLKLEIGLTYRENEDGSIYLTVSFGNRYEEAKKLFIYDDEHYGEHQSDKKLVEVPTLS